MDHTVPREKDVEFDLESGGNTSEEDVGKDRYVSDKESKGALIWAGNGIPNIDGTDKGKTEIESFRNSAKSGDVMIIDENSLEVFMDRAFVQQQWSNVHGNHHKQKIKPFHPKKPPKPPLPPTGPSLDAGDQKFVKELAELALRKRARVKKMKAVRKMKANKSSSSSTYTNLSAMVITVFFFLVIILHGIRSVSSATVGVIDSPEAKFAADESLISVRFPTSFNSNEVNVPAFHSSVLQER
ncbi:uncharacterized protein LOC114190275 isoform X1 [Vigna unguiculata]|uniref:uncharacterized protein LOC114190275 isoform X1 n=1 Tax=Vigna unguiculata TaxID=3917 RepID=UPI0010161313|nr:uncharacterized protein LOC114190275 isoform X1 [Vigna unguiculata]XP_027934891.1 uncharacterized protein LOC114190275 isoform X1 [Vigna unguiculata]